jgi:V8-like Glu-specific endopeptidase
MTRKTNAFLGFGTVLFLLVILLVLEGCGYMASGGGPFSNRSFNFSQSQPGKDRGLFDGGIVNGSEDLSPTTNALANSVVAVISLVGDDQALCTGSIIDKDLVLTAAHCVESNPDRMLLVFSKSLGASSAETRREVDGFVINPHWRHKWQGGKADVAILHFSGGIPKGFRPIHLAPTNLKLKIGSSVTMMGYGVSDGASRDGSGTLRSMKTKLLQNISSTEVMSDGKKSSVCFGDSGGPAFIKNGSHWVQWGIASSVTNKNCDQASVHTSVMEYLSWIKSAGVGLRL